MSIPEDAIMFQLGMLIGDTDTSHYLHVVATEPGAPDGEFGTAVYVIDPVKDGAPAADGITTTITQARLDHDRRGATIHFIALNQRMWIVPAERADPMAHQLQHEGWLSEHPHAAEVSVVYAAARDGRRWRSRPYGSGREDRDGGRLGDRCRRRDGVVHRGARRGRGGDPGLRRCAVRGPSPACLARGPASVNGRERRP
jgi:hypothetical protein